MADTKISDLTAITGANTASDDDLVVVDTSATQTKRITRDELKQSVLATGVIANGSTIRTNLGVDAAGTINYVHPNHSGEVTSAGDGATTISDNVVDEANLKVSNSPTNGYVLTAQSGNTGGLTWAAASGGATDLNGLSDALTNSSGVTVGIGTDALTNDDGSSNNNTAIGYKAGEDITSGSGNFFGGFQAGLNATTALYTVAIGNSAIGTGVLTGQRNIAIGQIAGNDLTSGESNIFAGYNSGGNATAGNYNIAIGHSPIGVGVLTGTDNIAIGRQAGNDLTSGNYNVAVGYRAGYELTTGIDNTLLGVQAGDLLTTGGNNTIIGHDAAASSATVSNEITLGNTTVDKFRVPGINFVIKDSTATDNYVLTVDANGEAGWEAAAGGGATDINGLSDGVTTTNSVGLGSGALAAITGTPNVVAVGIDALKSNTSGTNNVAVGKESLKSLTTANNNVAVGHGALEQAVNGAQNVGVGAFAAGANVNSIYLSAFGYGALTANTTGSNNTGLGGRAGDNITSGQNNTVIGFDADASSATVSNEITLGNSSISSLRCQVTSISSLSDRRDKKDIKKLPVGLDFINALNPVEFTWDMRDGAKVGQKEAGFIAQELDEAQQDAGVEELMNLVLKTNPDRLEASPGKLIPVLVKAIQELSSEIQTLKGNCQCQTK